MIDHVVNLIMLIYFLLNGGDLLAQTKPKQPSSKMLEEAKVQTATKQEKTKKSTTKTAI